MFHRPNVAAGVSLHRDRERRRMRWRRYDPAPEAAAELWWEVKKAAGVGDW